MEGGKQKEIKSQYAPIFHSHYRYMKLLYNIHWFLNEAECGERGQNNFWSDFYRPSATTGAVKDFLRDLWQLLLFMKKYGSPILQPRALRKQRMIFPQKFYGEKIVKAMVYAAENVADSRKIRFAM